ncbi:MAG: tetratricopeptide repeat protein [Saprospiraceae bacterium]
MLKNLLPLLLLFFSLSLLAQAGKTTEADMELEAVFIEGNREKLLSNWDKAIEKFEEVLAKDRTNAAAAYEMARVYEAKKDLENAEKYATKAVDWEGSNEWFRMYLAEVYQQNNKDILAAQQYEELVKMYPYNEDYYRKWAYFLVRGSQPEAAINVYNQLEQKVGIHEEVVRHKHTLYMGMGNTKMAASELERLIEKFPNNTSYWHLLGTFYEQVDEKAKAKDVYKKILAINPDDARAQIALAEGAKGNDDVLFLNSLKPVFEDPKTDIDTKIKEIFPYVNELASSGDKNLGNTLLALTSLLETVHSSDAKAHSVLADVLYYTGQTDRALEQYRKTLEIDDTKWAVWEQMLYIYVDKKDYDNLVKASEDALDIFPNQSTAYYLNGAGLNGKGDYQGALSSLQQALIMSSRNPRLRYDVLNETGKSYFFLKQYAKSDNAFEEALKINGNDPVILKNYSYYLAARGEQLDKAKDLATQLNKSAPNHPISLDAMAFVLYKRKDYSNAKQWLDKALQSGGNEDPTILEHYGDVLYQLGNTTEAIQYWQLALDKGGDSEFLERKVKEGKMVE